MAGEEPGDLDRIRCRRPRPAGRRRVRDFAEVLDGRDPVSGSGLRTRRGDRSVAGYDLTFCAPKSVSVLHLLAPREIATEVGRGHQAAVEEATGYLERAAVGVRRSHRGEAALLPSTGAVAGQFLHRTSRALDPHLHTHLVMANVAQGVDGRWSAVDSRRLFAHLRAAQGDLPRPAPARTERAPGRHLGRAPLRPGRRGRGRCHPAPAVLAALGGHGRIPDATGPDRGGVDPIGRGRLPRHPSRQGSQPHRSVADGRVEAAGERLRHRPRRSDPGGGDQARDAARVDHRRRTDAGAPGRVGARSPHPGPTGPGGRGRRRVDGGCDCPHRRVGGGAPGRGGRGPGRRRRPRPGGPV